MTSAAEMAKVDQAFANETRQIDRMVQGVADQLKAEIDPSVIFASFTCWVAQERPDPHTAGALLAAAVIKLARHEERQR